MRSAKFNQRFIFISIIFLTVLGFGCRGEEPGRISTGAAGSEIAAKPVFWVDDYPVSVEEIKQFSVRFIKQSPSDHDESPHGSTVMGEMDFQPLELIRPYVRFFSIIKEGEARGLKESPDFRKVLEFGRLRLLGEQYSRYLRDNAVIPPERIASNLPSSWVKVNFQLYLFRTWDDAKKAYLQVDQTGDQALTRLAELASPLAGDRRPETGLIFTDSGFFDSVDDAYLYTLQQGDLSRPVITGLGPAIVYIKRRHDFNDEEKNAYLSKMRNRLEGEYGSQAVKLGIEKIGIQTDRQAIGRGVATDITSGVWPEDVIIAEIGDSELTYYQFRWLVTPNFPFYKKAYPLERLPSLVEGDVRRFIQTVALGVAAQDDSNFVEPVTLAEEIEWLRKNILYQMTQSVIWSETTVPVNEEELKRYYEDNRNQFGTPAMVRFQSYFTPVKEDIDKLYQRYQDGTPFEKLADDIDLTGPVVKAPHKEGLKLKTQRIVKTGQDPLAEVLFPVAIGDVRLVDSKMGYHLVKIIGKAPESTPSYDDIKQQVEDRYTRELRRARVMRKFEDLENSHKIRLHEQSPEGTPDRDFKDTG